MDTVETKVFVVASSRREAEILAERRGWTDWTRIHDTTPLRGRQGGTLIITTCWSARHQHTLADLIDAASVGGMRRRFAQCVLNGRHHDEP